MPKLIYSNNLDRIYQYLLIFLGFAMPFSTALGKIIASLIAIIWIFSGNYKNKLVLIINNKVAVASLLFFGIHLMGMLWTEDIFWGFHILKKMIEFLIFLPIFITITRKENISWYIGGFLLSIVITQIVSFGILSGIIEPFKNARIYNPTPFMSSISHGPFLAFGFYIFLRIYYQVKISYQIKIVALISAFACAIGIFTTNGRAGQVVYFAVLLILFFQHYGFSKIAIKKFLFVSFVTIILAFSFSKSFETRLNMAIDETVSYSKAQNTQDVKNTSVGLRLVMAENSLEIIKEAPIFGQGTGDFKETYRVINSIRSPQLPNVENPHNMYILILVQLGFVGLFFMINLFYQMYKYSMSQTNQLVKDIGIALPTLFLIINFSDSYLLGHYTTFLFIYFASFVYSTIPNNEIYSGNNSKI